LTCAILSFDDQTGLRPGTGVLSEYQVVNGHGMDYGACAKQCKRLHAWAQPALVKPTHGRPPYSIIFLTCIAVAGVTFI